MKTPANIEIITHQKPLGEKGEFATIQSDALINFESGTAYIEFDDNLSKILIAVSKDLITVNKLGEENYTIILEEGRRKNFNIMTAGVSLPVSILAKKVTSKFTQSEVTANIQYDIESAAGNIETRIKIKCKWQEE